MNKVNNYQEMKEWLSGAADKRSILFFIPNGRMLECGFLRFAKHEGYTWTDGSDIDPEADGCGHFMSLNSEHKMGYVSGMLYQTGREHEHFAYADTEAVCSVTDI
ncbi:MAG: hypothetical protein WCY62_02055 [Clostridia bacterium]